LLGMFFERDDGHYSLISVPYGLDCSSDLRVGVPSFCSVAVNTSWHC